MVQCLKFGLIICIHFWTPTIQKGMNVTFLSNYELSRNIDWNI